MFNLEEAKKICEPNKGTDPLARAHELGMKHWDSFRILPEAIKEIEKLTKALEKIKELRCSCYVSYAGNKIAKEALAQAEGK